MAPQRKKQKLDKPEDVVPDNLAASSGFRNPNVEWHLKIETAVATIVKYYGKDIITADALPEKEGYGPPLKEKVAQDRMADQSNTDTVVATGCVNVLWSQPTFTLTPAVGINQTAVFECKRTLYGSGKVVPQPLPIDFKCEKKSPCRGVC